MSAGGVLLWRHGQTSWNALGRLQGQSDVELDEVGLEQALAAAEVIGQRPVGAIVSSDLVRAARTADALAAVTGLPVRSDVRLRERAFGDWEGLVHDEMRAQWPEQYRVWTTGGQPEAVGMELRVAVGGRVAAAVEDHAAALTDEQVLVVVTHGAAISAGITTLLGLDAGTWSGIAGLSNCHWSLLRPTVSRTPPWRLTVHNVSA